MPLIGSAGNWQYVETFGYGTPDYIEMSGVVPNPYVHGANELVRNTGVSRVASNSGTATPGERIFSISIVDGIRCFGGDPAARSTGRVRPATLTGWTRSENAVTNDNNYATAAVTSGATPDLIASGFKFNLPVGAVVQGIRVVVQRGGI